MSNSFDPDEMNVLAKVIDAACLKLGAADDTTRHLLASRVLDRAAQGERDFEKLLSVALSRRAGADAA